MTNAPTSRRNLSRGGARTGSLHDLRHAAATRRRQRHSLKALMARIGHASAAAALRYQHVIDGQDAEIVRYLVRIGEQPPVPTGAADDPAGTDPLERRVGHEA